MVEKLDFINETKPSIINRNEDSIDKANEFIETIINRDSLNSTDSRRVTDSSVNM